MATVREATRKAMDELSAEFDRRLRAERRAIEEEYRIMHRCDGARSAIRALLDAGVITDDFSQDLREWLNQGGVARLEVRSYQVVPPQ